MDPLVGHVNHYYLLLSPAELFVRSIILSQVVSGGSSFQLVVLSLLLSSTKSQSFIRSINMLITTMI